MQPLVFTDSDQQAGREMHGWLRDLFPICRSLTGPGVVETLAYLKARLPGLHILEIPSGTQVFDWTVPDEWTIRDAWIEGPDGKRFAEFRVNNLHVLGYSEPVDRVLSLADLQAHLYSLPDQPDAIPYVTSYYRRNWGFCLTHRQRQALPSGNYRVHIDSTLEPGLLRIGELIIPGETDREVLLSTYVCHPSMANNELSGPVLATALARSLLAGPKPQLTHRILFLAETIGSIAYLASHCDALQQHLQAGFVLTCVGDERAVSYLASRKGGTLADRVAVHVLNRHAPGYTSYPFTTRGSDERQYCAPGVDLPVASVMRSKYATFPEYHTSLDDATLVTPNGLAGSFALYRRMLDAINVNGTWTSVYRCEPQLGKRGLYPQTSTKDVTAQVELQMNILTYCDGTEDLLAIAERLDVDIAECRPIIDRLVAGGVLRRIA